MITILTDHIHPDYHLDFTTFTWLYHYHPDYLLPPWLTTTTLILPLPSRLTTTTLTAHYHPNWPLPPLYLPRADSPRSICCASEPVSPSHNSMYTAVKRNLRWGQFIDWFIKIMVYLRILYFTQEVLNEMTNLISKLHNFREFVWIVNNKPTRWFKTLSERSQKI